MSRSSKALFCLNCCLIIQVFAGDAPTDPSSPNNDAYEAFKKECHGTLPNDPRSDLRQFQEQAPKPVYSSIHIFSDNSENSIGNNLHPELLKPFQEKLIQFMRSNSDNKRLPASFEVDLALRYYDVSPQDFNLCLNTSKAELDASIKQGKQLLSEASAEEKEQFQQELKTLETINTQAGRVVGCLNSLIPLSPMFLKSDEEKKAKLDKSFDEVAKAYQENFSPLKWSEWVPRSGKFTSSTALVGEQSTALDYLREGLEAATSQWSETRKNQSGHAQGTAPANPNDFHIAYDKTFRSDIGPSIISEALNLQGTFYSNAELSQAWENTINELTRSKRNYHLTTLSSKPLYQKIKNHLKEKRKLTDNDINALDLSDDSTNPDKEAIRAEILAIIKNEIALKVKEYIGSSSFADSSVYKNEKAEKDTFARREQAKQVEQSRSQWLRKSNEEKAASIQKSFGEGGHNSMPYWKDDGKSYSSPWVGTKEFSDERIPIGPGTVISEEDLWNRSIQSAETCREKYKLLMQYPGSVLTEFVHEKRIPGKGYEEYYQLNPAQQAYINSCVEANALNAFQHAPPDNLTPEQMKAALHTWHKDYVSKISECSTYATLGLAALRDQANQAGAQALREVLARENSLALRAIAAKGADPTTTIETAERGALLLQRSQNFYRHDSDISKAQFNDAAYAADKSGENSILSVWGNKGKKISEKYGLKFSNSKDLRLLDYSSVKPAQLRALLKDEEALKTVGILSGDEQWNLDLINLRLLDAFYQQQEAFAADPQHAPPPERPPLLMIGNTVINIRNDYGSSSKQEQAKRWEEESRNNKALFEEYSTLQRKAQKNEFMTPEERALLDKKNWDAYVLEKQKRLGNKYFKTETHTITEYQEKFQKFYDDMSKSLDTHDRELLEKSSKRDGFFYGARKTWAAITDGKEHADEEYKDAKSERFFNQIGWEGRASFELGIDDRKVPKSLVDTAGFIDSRALAMCHSGVVNPLNASGRNVMAETQQNVAASEEIIKQILDEADKKADKAVASFCTDIALTAAVALATAGVGSVLLRAGTIGVRSVMAARAVSVGARLGQSALKAERLLQPLAKAGTVLEASSGFAKNTATAFRTFFTGGSSGLYRPAIQTAFRSGVSVGGFGYAIMPVFATGFTAATEGLSRLSRGARDKIFGHDDSIPPDPPFGKPTKRVLMLLSEMDSHIQFPELETLSWQSELADLLKFSLHEASPPSSHKRNSMTF
ncbi:MAG: hypothetical protein R3A80_10845 [Bdellovibrionota bacterium]